MVPPVAGAVPVAAERAVAADVSQQLLEGQHHGRAKPSSSMPRVLGVLIQARGLKCPMYGEVNFVLIVLLAARRKNSLSKMFCGLEHYP